MRKCCMPVIMEWPGSACSIQKLYWAILLFVKAVYTQQALTDRAAIMAWDRPSRVLETVKKSSVKETSYLSTSDLALKGTTRIKPRLTFLVKNRNAV